MKLRTIVLWVFLWVNFVQLNAQSVKGRVVDGDSSFALPKASVRIAPVSDSSKARMMVADTSAQFNFSGLDTGNYFITISFTGYDVSRQRVSVIDSMTDLGDIRVYRKLGALGNVTVVGRTPPARQKGDTTELNASAFKVNPDATTEDLIKKAPGITVENGVVTAQGEEVKKVTIDGREFFGDDASAALKNLPAEVVDKIQVFDRASDQAQLTGVDDGNSVKSINIVTRADMRNGQFGRIYAGYGTDERYASGASVNIFKGDRRINLLGLFNNVNQQNFSGEDLLGVSGSANSGRGNRGRGGGGGNNFQVGMQPGIAKTNAAGINYSDLWLNRKMTVTGSYFFNNSRTDARSQTSRELFLPGDSSQFYNEEKSTVSYNTNHRVNMRMEYKIDSNNTLIVAPSLSLQENNSDNKLVGVNTTELSKVINSTINKRHNEGNAYNLRADINYRHAFDKRGRSLTLSLNGGGNHSSGNVNLDAISGFADSTDFLALDTVRQLTNSRSSGYNINPGISYSEPLGKGLLQFNYSHPYSKSNADQLNNFYDKATGAYTDFDTTLSNKFLNTVNANNAGVSYRVGDQSGQFSVGVNYQGTTLNSDQEFPFAGNVHKTFENILPNLQFRKNFTKQSNLRINYRTSVNAPSVNQLQNVVNNSNPLFITSGNPFLNQSYTHFLNGRYSLANPTKGNSFFAGLFLQLVNDYITNATYIPSQDSVIAKGIVLRKGAQLSIPANLDGYKRGRAFLTYGFAIKPIKTNLNLNAGFNYVRTPGLINNVQNISDNYSVNAGITLASNISEYIDYNLSYSGNFNRVNNTLQPQLNNKYYYHSIGLKVNLLTKSGWFILNDLSNQVYSGLADGYNQDFWLWNLSAGKKFLKNRRGELRASVFDLLKQNQSISRNVTDSYIEDVQTVVLQQYFMLTFTYTLRNFGQQAAAKSKR
jgi:hypothetical protein